MPNQIRQTADNNAGPDAEKDPESGVVVNKGPNPKASLDVDKSFLAAPTRGSTDKNHRRPRPTNNQRAGRTSFQFRPQAGNSPMAAPNHWDRGLGRCPVGDPGKRSPTTTKNLFLSSFVNSSYCDQQSMNKCYS